MHEEVKAAAKGLKEATGGCAARLQAADDNAWKKRMIRRGQIAHGVGQHVHGIRLQQGRAEKPEGIYGGQQHRLCRKNLLRWRM